jgi:hypothetical protein
MSANEKLEMYVIYYRPKDHPTLYVLRKWNISNVGASPDDEFAMGETLDEIRSLVPHYCVRLERDPNDDPVIVESWI